MKKTRKGNYKTAKNRIIFIILTNIKIWENQALASVRVGASTLTLTLTQINPCLPTCYYGLVRV